MVVIFPITGYKNIYFAILECVLITNYPPTGIHVQLYDIIREGTKFDHILYDISRI